MFLCLRLLSFFVLVIGIVKILVMGGSGMKRKLSFKKIIPFKDMSIRYKFYVLFAISTAIIGLFMILSNYLSTKAIVKKAANQSYREAVLIADLMDSYFADAVSYAQLLTIDSKFQENLVSYTLDDTTVNRAKVRSNVVQIVNSYMIARPIFSDISITDYKYSMIYKSDINAPNPEEVVNTIVKDKDAIPIFPEFTGLMTFTSKTGNQPGLALVKSVIEKESGEKIGIIVVYMLESDIEKIYSANGFHDGEITIVNSENDVLSSTQKDNLFGTMDIGNLSELDQEGSYFTADKDGTDVIVSISKMSGTGWRIINKVKLSQVTRELADTRENFMVIMILGFIFSGLSSYVISKSVLNPVLRLSNAMESFPQNQTFDLYIEVDSNDEVGRLGKIFNKMMSQMSDLVAEKNLQQRFIREYEVRLLQAQINPHFLYNSLETIIMLQQLDLKEESIDAAKNLASFYRLTLNRGDDFITVKDEIDLSSNYLSIQKYRYIEFMDYSIDIEPDVMGYIMPKLTLQPILENAIYHGLKAKNGGNIKLIGTSVNGDIHFIIYDDGMGIEQKKINELFDNKGVRDNVDSFGIPSIDKKLKLLYGEDYGLSIISKLYEYTKVTIKIPKMVKAPEESI